MLGREAYEEDCRRHPTYLDGSPRKRWSELDEIAQKSWSREPYENRMKRLEERRAKEPRP